MLSLNILDWHKRLRSASYSDLYVHWQSGGIWPVGMRMCWSVKLQKQRQKSPFVGANGLDTEYWWWVLCFHFKLVTTGLRCLSGFIQVSHLPDTSAASSLPISEVLPPSSGKKLRQHSDRLFCPLFLCLFFLFTWLHYFQSESQLIGGEKKLGAPTSSPGRVCTVYSRAESSAVAAGLIPTQPSSPLSLPLSGYICPKGKKAPKISLKI